MWRGRLLRRIDGAEYDLEIWMPRLLAARRFEGATLEELLDEAAGDRALDAVALYLADIALKGHDTKLAIAYLETAEDYHGARGHHARENRQGVTYPRRLRKTAIPASAINKAARGVLPGASGVEAQLSSAWRSSTTAGGIESEFAAVHPVVT